MKTIVITGASRGIGLATARKFLADGWRVIGTYRKHQIPFDDARLTKIELDLGSPTSIARAAEAIKKIAPNVDVLVNNAAIILDAQDETVDLEKIRKTFEADVFGTIDLTEKLLAHMRSGGHIITIDSLYGAFSFPIDDTSSIGYRMAKAALNMYTRTLAFQLKTKGVIVSSLDPGWVKTDMGNAAATKTEGPDREPEDAAEDIYKLATGNVESGCFWRFGKKREW